MLNTHTCARFKSRRSLKQLLSIKCRAFDNGRVFVANANTILSRFTDAHTQPFSISAAFGFLFSDRSRRHFVRPRRLTGQRLWQTNMHSSCVASYRKPPRDVSSGNDTKVTFCRIAFSRTRQYTSAHLPLRVWLFSVNRRNISEYVWFWKRISARLKSWKRVLKKKTTTYLKFLIQPSR